MNKQIDWFPKRRWPRFCSLFLAGKHMRELQNLIERAVIMTPGNVLQIQVSDLQESNRILSSMAGTLEDVERQRILQVSAGSRRGHRRTAWRGSPAGPQAHYFVV